MKKIGFIGAGNMAGALIRGMVRAGAASRRTSGWPTRSTVSSAD